MADQDTFQGQDGLLDSGRWDDNEVGLHTLTFDYGGLVRRAVERLPSKLQQPLLSCFVAILATPFQEIKDALAEIRYKTRLENAVGVQLDNIGTIVDLPRNGLNDEQYRLFLKVRVLVLASDGTFEVVAAIMNTLFGSDNFQIIEDFPLGFIIIDTSGTSIGLRQFIVNILRGMPALAVKFSTWYGPINGLPFGFEGTPGAAGWDEGVWLEEYE